MSSNNNPPVSRPTLAEAPEAPAEAASGPVARVVAPSTETPASASAEKGSSTEPKFGDIWKSIESRYGAKPEKPKEIKKSLGKDDFLRIMITQMKNQDPTQPFKADQMASQMAQYASVEQLQNLNNSMAKMASQNRPLERMAMTQMIGKTVTTDRDRFQHEENTQSSLNYRLPKDATHAKITVLSEAGEAIFEKDLGPLKAGEGSYLWNGNKTNGMPVKSGHFTFRIDATAENGSAIQIDSRAQARVIGVSFEGGEPIFLVGDPAHPSRVTMNNIVRIDSDGPAPIPGAQSLSSAVQGQGAQPEARGPSFFSFKKGEGSSNLDPGALSPEARAALGGFQPQAGDLARAQAEAAVRAARAAAAPAPVPTAAAPVKAEGFPNGLTDSDDVSTTAVNPKTEKGGDIK